jgi:hypothetical protein
VRGTTTTRLAALGTTVALIAGCNGGSDPGATPSRTNGTGTASSSTTSAATSTGKATTPSGTATVTIPAAARAHTEDGAEAFAIFYTKEMDRATTSANSKPLQVLALPSCVACTSIIDLVDDYRKSGQRQRQSSVRVKLAQAQRAAPNTVVVDVLVDDLAHEVIAADGSVVSKSPAAKINFRHTVSWTASGWRISDSEIVQ